MNPRRCDCLILWSILAQGLPTLAFCFELSFSCGSCVALPAVFTMETVLVWIGFPSKPESEGEDLSSALGALLLPLDAASTYHSTIAIQVFVNAAEGIRCQVERPAAMLHSVSVRSTLNLTNDRQAQPSADMLLQCLGHFFFLSDVFGRCGIVVGVVNQQGQSLVSHVGLPSVAHIAVGFAPRTFRLCRDTTGGPALRSIRSRPVHGLSCEVFTFVGAAAKQRSAAPLCKQRTRTSAHCNWRRGTSRSDRLSHTFMGAIAKATLRHTTLQKNGRHASAHFRRRHVNIGRTFTNGKGVSRQGSRGAL